MDNTISSSSTASSTSNNASTSGTTSSQTTHEFPSRSLTHSHQIPQHQHRPGPRQARASSQRESQHYPMAERCMCSSCHLSAKLFPRTDDGRIMLPIVPVTRSVSSHIEHAHSGNATYNGDLAQYMLAPSDGHSGRPRPSCSSIATSSSVMAHGPHGSGPSPQPNQHGQQRVRRSTISNDMMKQRFNYAHMSPSLLDKSAHTLDDHAGHLDDAVDTEMKATTLIGPGVAGAHGVSPLQPPAHAALHPHSHSPLHTSPSLAQHNRSNASSRQTIREYNPMNHEMVIQVSVNRPSTGSYTGPPLPPHPAIAPMASLTINPSAGRGRPKGKAKAKVPAVHHDDSSEGGSSTRNSPMLGGSSHRHIGNSIPDALMSVDRTVGLNSSPGDLSGQAELAPCKPRRGRPPRHEVVPGMGEFTVFL